MTLCFSHRENDPFARIDKRIVYDNSISWKAKGILLYAFSQNDNWQFYRNEMMRHSSDGEHSFDSGIKELEAAGYLHKKRTKKKTGVFAGWNWHFFEIPVTPNEFEEMYKNSNGGNSGHSREDSNKEYREGGFPNVGETGENSKNDYREGGFPGFGETPSSGKPQTNKNNSSNKNNSCCCCEAEAPHIEEDSDVDMSSSKGVFSSDEAPPISGTDSSPTEKAKESPPPTWANSSITYNGPSGMIHIDESTFYRTILQRNLSYSKEEIAYALKVLAEYAGIVHDWVSFLDGTVKRYRENFIGSAKWKKKSWAASGTKAKKNSKSSFETPKESSSENVTRERPSRSVLSVIKEMKNSQGGAKAHPTFV